DRGSKIEDCELLSSILDPRGRFMRSLHVAWRRPEIMKSVACDVRQSSSLSRASGSRLLRELRQAGSLSDIFRRRETNETYYAQTHFNHAARARLRRGASLRAERPIADRPSGQAIPESGRDC